MSEALSQPAPPRSFLPLPGFMPDAVPYAARLALAMVLAYGVSFAIQLDSASSAGVCVGIVMQPSIGMTMSKAAYRIAGTLAGGAASLVIVGLFPQDRTVLLMAVALWLGGCTFLASLLRDFRAYGAVLAGYTVSVIAIGQIDAPANAFLATLDRVAAILVGIACVAVVNTLFAAAFAHEHLVDELERHERELRESAAELLHGGTGPERIPHIERAAAILGLQTEASYASAELADGISRNHAASASLAALLDMLAASRELRRALAAPGSPAPETLAQLRATAGTLAPSPSPPTLPDPPARLPPTPLDALLLERATGLAEAADLARRTIRATRTGNTAGLPRYRRLRTEPNYTAALVNALRTVAATALGALICILGNDSTTTLLLIQISAFTALIGLQPNPSASAALFLPPLPFAVILTAAVAFLALPLASGFVPFALAVGAATFLLGLVTRQARTAPYAPALLIYFTILLSPSNVQSFDPATFANTALQLLLSACLTTLAFRLLLPVQPHLRLLAIGGTIVASLRRALCPPTGRSVAEPDVTLAFDRLAQALLWARARHPGRPAAINGVLARLCAFTELEFAARRASAGLHALASTPAFAEAARTGLRQIAANPPHDRPAALEQTARTLLAHPAAVTQPGPVLQAVSGLHGTALLLRQQAAALPHYGVAG